MWKNRLQEYCQKEKIPLPIYRLKKQSGPGHLSRFQIEVQINGHWYAGDQMCSSKKEAEKFAAKKALEMLDVENGHPLPLDHTPMPQTPDGHLDEPPSCQKTVNADPIEQNSDGYTDIERFISDKVGSVGGRIRKISFWGTEGKYKFEICGSYRYCDNVRQHHKENEIFFIVNPVNRSYVQRCNDPDCCEFQSARKYIDNDQRTHLHEQDDNSIVKCTNCSNGINYRNRSDCGRCREIFCNSCIRECDYCHSAAHCERCFDSCFDCHDSS